MADALVNRQRTTNEPANDERTVANVDVWIASLNQSRPVLSACLAVLSPSEIHSAGRFATVELKEHFVVSRAARRHILARYTGQGPALLEFETTLHGKPFLPHFEWHFNVSHSGSLFACAVTRPMPVGIDIERIQEITHLFEIASDHFALGESARLRKMQPDCQTQGFFECWTRKEAFVKATGLGLSQDLRGFEVAFGPGMVPQILSLYDSSRSAEQWSLRAFDPGPDYCGALAIRAQSVRLAFYNLEPDMMLRLK
jgi:4'-phosphopantetheinyl transferase